MLLSRQLLGYHWLKKTLRDLQAFKAEPKKAKCAHDALTQRKTGMLPLQMWIVNMHLFRPQDKIAARSTSAMPHLPFHSFSTKQWNFVSLCSPPRFGFDFGFHITLARFVHKDIPGGGQGLRQGEVGKKHSELTVTMYHVHVHSCSA